MQNPKTSPSRILWECFYTNAGCDATPRPVHMIYKNSADCFGLWRRFALLVVPRFRPIAVRLLQRFLLQTPAAQLSWTKPSELPWDQLRRAFSPAAAPSQTPSRGLQRDEGAAPPRPASSTRPPSGPSPPTSPQRGRAGGSFPGEGPWEAGGGLRETGGRTQGSRGKSPEQPAPVRASPPPAATWPPPASWAGISARSRYRGLLPPLLGQKSLRYSCAEVWELAKTYPGYPGWRSSVFQGVAPQAESQLSRTGSEPFLS